MAGRSAPNGGSRTATLDISADGRLSAVSIVRHRGHQLWYVVYIYIERETTTYCSDIQAFIVAICYTDRLTARWR
jgi:hypothetical protein